LLLVSTQSFVLSVNTLSFSMSECSLNVIDRTLAKVNVFDKQRIADLDINVFQHRIPFAIFTSYNSADLRSLGKDKFTHLLACDFVMPNGKCWDRSIVRELTRKKASFHS
jgi:hypothetical protein